MEPVAQLVEHLMYRYRLFPSGGAGNGYFDSGSGGRWFNPSSAPHKNNSDGEARGYFVKRKYRMRLFL